MNRLHSLRPIALLAGPLLVLAGCAPMPERPDGGQGGRDAGWLSVPVNRVAGEVATGDTRAQVRERLGGAAEARFASGREIWVYRFGDRAARGEQAAQIEELVILFDPQGRVQRSRVRHADGSE